MLHQPTVADAVRALDAFYPPALKEDWDQIGLVCGDPAAPVAKAAFAVDPTLEAVGQAIEWGADLMVVHHPLLLRPVSSVAATTFKGAIVHRLIRAGCALYTAHTNADAAAGGVADALAASLGLSQVVPLAPKGADGAVGIGRVGRLPAPLRLGELAQRLADGLPPNRHGVRIAGHPSQLVERVALVGGAGDSLFDAVRAAGVDVYITADLRHHPALEARQAAEFDGAGRPYLLDVSHAASEWGWLQSAAERLADALAGTGARLQTWVIEEVADPWTARVERTDG
ncbi:MAG: Nif3-like dinuclear metal center hexameric protein [Bifidobacteriaceae bacterium]|jgi:dinuclear metal center YbgI/SA1388 family protein|nr:Nif3-like dinuclear metal center hexameric protein [Bifidobacteriaceae bacterium]